MAVRADDNGPFKEFTFGGWLRDGYEGMCTRLHCKPTLIDTSGFESHMRSSAKEQLLAMRSLIDGLIERVDQPEAEVAVAEEKAPPKKRTRSRKA